MTYPQIIPYLRHLLQESAGGDDAGKIMMTRYGHSTQEMGKFKRKMIHKGYVRVKDNRMEVTEEGIEVYLSHCRLCGIDHVRDLI